MNGKFCSIGEILWRVLKQPICTDLTLEQASEYALEFLRLIGAPLSFVDKVTNPPLKLTDYKVALPADLIEIRGVKCNNRPLRYATDLYHLSIDEDKDCSYYKEYTYIVQNCVLIASVKDECIEVSYKSISTDENGYPMIPDNESYRMGLEYYIMHRYLEPLWTMGKITDKVFQYYEQKRHWYMGQASSALTIANMDQLESMMNGINRLIINDHAYQTFYKNYGVKERIRKH